MRNRRGERGAAAVEFALIVLPFLALIFALIDLGWVFNQQLAVTTAAREAVRYYAIHHEEAGAQGTAEGIAEGHVPDAALSFTWVTCTEDADAEASVVVSMPLTDLTGWVAAAAPGATQAAEGAMRCGG